MNVKPISASAAHESLLLHPIVHPSPFPSPLSIMKSIPTQRTTTGITTPKPPKKTAGMKAILARRALLLRRLHIRADDTIADGALALPLQRTLDIASERQQAVDKAAVAEHDDALDGAEPRLPLLFGDGDAGAGGDERVGEGVVGWEGDAEGYWGRFGIDRDGGDDFGGAGVDF